MQEEVLTGTIKWFNVEKGYGFIEQSEGVDLFVHQSQLESSPKAGDGVTFNINQAQKGPCAVNVIIDKP